MPIEIIWVHVLGGYVQRLNRVKAPRMLSKTSPIRSGSCSCAVGGGGAGTPDGAPDGDGGGGGAGAGAGVGVGAGTGLVPSRCPSCPPSQAPYMSGVVEPCARTSL